MALRKQRKELRDGTVGNDEEKPESISTTLKDELLLIGFLVLFVGIISTDTYYATFGVKYQFLSLPSFHIVYRGLTILTDAPYLLLPYGLVVIYLWLNRSFDWHGANSLFNRWRTLLSYAVILAMLAVTYPLARYAGKKQAELDLQETTTTLPEVVNLVLDEQETEISDIFSTNDTHYRLLLIDSDYVVLFKPLKAGATGVLPNIKRIGKGDLHVIET